ncbi:MAG: hypothetical protein J5606_02600 [Bacteroidales bacterium]|nr:hypothetical protein [Bacteroidales bacterium]
MKKVLNIAFIVAIVMCGLGSCKKSTNGIATYYGVVMNENTDAPLKGANVKVTNGEKIHVLTKTSDDGSYSVEVRLAEINKDYYILIEGYGVNPKKVNFPAFGNGSYDVGTIVVKGPTTPTIETQEVLEITAKTADVKGRVIDNGGYAVIHRGVCWGDNPYPDIFGNHTEDGIGNGNFMSYINNLQPNTTYYVRAYATNEIGTNYGKTISFTTLSGLPIVTTFNISKATATSAKTGGETTDDGGFSITERGICWSFYPNPTINDNKIAAGIGKGKFESTISNIDLTNTTNKYYIRAYATNENGTAYGNEIILSYQHFDYEQLPRVEYNGYIYVLFYDMNSMNWNEAKQTCENLVYAGYDDWTLLPSNAYCLTKIMDKCKDGWKNEEGEPFIFISQENAVYAEGGVPDDFDIQSAKYWCGESDSDPNRAYTTLYHTHKLINCSTCNRTWRSEDNYYYHEIKTEQIGDYPGIWGLMKFYNARVRPIRRYKQNLF